MKEKNESDDIVLSKGASKFFIDLLDSEINWMSYIENNRADIHRSNRRAAKENRQYLEKVRQAIIDDM